MEILHLACFNECGNSELKPEVHLEVMNAKDAPGGGKIYEK